MKINIDISVIIPAFNAADSIGVLVHTLLGETTLSTEIIVVDDGSTDETWTVLSAITDERLILIRQENQGVYAARNAALAIYRGEWVVFLDADDRVAADFLQERLRTAREAQADVVLFNARHTDSVGHLRHPVHRRQPYGQTLTGQQWIRHCVSQREWPHYLWLQIIRSAYIREHDLRFQEGKSHKDILWTIQLAAADGRFYFSDIQDYLWVNNPASITHRSDYYDIPPLSGGLVVVFICFSCLLTYPGRMSCTVSWQQRTRCVRIRTMPRYGREGDCKSSDRRQSLRLRHSCLRRCHSWR